MVVEGIELVSQLESGDAGTVLARARMARTRLTLVSPLKALMPRGGGDPVAGNEEAARVVPENEGLMQWVVIDPRVPRTFEQAGEMLSSPYCCGIKIHPEEHLYRIAEHGRTVFEFAAAHGAVISSHSGEPNSSPEDFIPFADEFPGVKLILAHLGYGHDGYPGHQVRAIQASKHGNVFTDTSSGQSMVSGLIEWAVGEVGAERILYGSDSPLYFAPVQRARIDLAEITDAEKRLILYENAERLLGLGGKGEGAGTAA